MVWRDDTYQRVVPTGFGSVVIERGETAILIVGKTFGPRVLELLKLLHEDAAAQLEDVK
jgi:hypothetical protein